MKLCKTETVYKLYTLLYAFIINLLKKKQDGN